MIVGTTVPHYYPSKIFILSYTLVTIHIPIICIIILTINIFNRNYGHNSLVFLSSSRSDDFIAVQFKNSPRLNIVQDIYGKWVFYGYGRLFRFHLCVYIATISALFQGSNRRAKKSYLPQTFVSAVPYKVDIAKKLITAVWIYIKTKNFKTFIVLRLCSY